MKQYKTKYTKMTVPSNLELQLGLASITETPITLLCYANNKQEALQIFKSKDEGLNWLALKNIEVA